MHVLSEALILTQIFVTRLCKIERAASGLLGDSVIVSGEIKMLSVLDPMVSAMTKC
jgi:hypothetical protein